MQKCSCDVVVCVVSIFRPSATESRVGQNRTGVRKIGITFGRFLGGVVGRRGENVSKKLELGLSFALGNTYAVGDRMRVKFAAKQRG